MSSSAIGIRYAKALLNIASEKKMIEPYADELASVASVLKSEDLLRLLLDSPTFPLEKKTAIVTDLCGLLELNDGMKTFLTLLVEKDRISYIPQIILNYRKFADEISGVIRAKITSANTLSEDRADALKKGLEQQTGKQVVLSIETDKSLIGGLQAEMDGKLFDGSVKTQLKRIEATLAKG